MRIRMLEETLKKNPEGKLRGEKQTNQHLTKKFEMNSMGVLMMAIIVY